MRETFEQTMARLDTTAFIQDYNKLTNIELQEQYDLSEARFFELCHYFKLSRRTKRKTPEEHFKVIDKFEFINFVSKFGNLAASKKFNLSIGQVAYLNQFLGIKLTQTYDEFKETVDIKKFISYVQNGGTGYSSFLNTKNNRFINKLVYECGLSKAHTLTQFERTINIIDFETDYRSLSYTDLASKYGVSQQLIKKLANKLHLTRDPSLRKELLKQSICKHAADLSLSYDEYLSRAANMANISKYKHGTSNSSLIECFITKELAKYYTLQKQYCSVEYPYACDIYLPSQAVFIEINAHWTHGFHPYNLLNKQDATILDGIKAKQKVYINHKGYLTKNSYFTAERVWTIKDPEKLAVAIKNNLQYIRIYMTRDHKLTIYFLNMPNELIDVFKNLFYKIFENSDYIVDKFIV